MAHARRKRLQSASDGSPRHSAILLPGAIVQFAYGLFVAKSNEVWAALLLGLSSVVRLAFYLIISLNSRFRQP